jgi:hypothetical protein
VIEKDVFIVGGDLNTVVHKHEYRLRSPARYFFDFYGATHKHDRQQRIVLELFSFSSMFSFTFYSDKLLTID